jgi:hypothetical protein
VDELFGGSFYKKGPSPVVIQQSPTGTLDGLSGIHVTSLPTGTLDGLSGINVTSLVLLTSRLSHAFSQS